MPTPNSSKLTSLLLQHKEAETALPAAPKAPNPAPQPPKTPSFTTRPPAIREAVADVRPGLASQVTVQNQSLGTAKSPSARRVAVSKQVMTPKEFETVKAVPLAKTAGLLSWLRDNIFLNGNVVNAGYRTMMGGEPTLAPTYFKPGTSQVRPSHEIVKDLNDSAKAVATSLPTVPAAAGATGVGAAIGGAALGTMGGHGMVSGIEDAAGQVQAGDYGSATRSLLGALVSGAFPAASKYRIAHRLMAGAAGALGATDAGRAVAYGRNGMPSASRAAAVGALADLSLLMPWSRSLRTVLPAIATSSVARPLEDRFAQQALGDRVKDIYDRALGPTVAAAQSRLAGAGIRDAAGTAKDIGDMASTVAHAVDTERPFKPSFLSGLLATKDLQYVKALENEAAHGGTAGSRTAANSVRETIDSILGRPGSMRARLSSAAGWLSRNGKWAIPAAGALVASAAGLKLYNAIRSRRKQKEQQ